MTMRRTHRARRELGQVALLFALAVPMVLALGGVVVGIGNWYVHGKNLQTKADAGALAGGGRWEFPCGSGIDTQIDTTARAYAGANNPQVGGVPNTNVHTVLNGTAWYDDDSNPLPAENNLFPPSTSLCSSMKLDVKVTEDNSFPLASLIPLFPDIKRRARVEIQEAEGIFGLLPVAVRAPEPLSAAAVFYDESAGSVPAKKILAVKYFVKSNSVAPGGLQGWTTFNSEDGTAGANTWAKFAMPSNQVGVAIAISFRGACYDASIPGGPAIPQTQTKITTSPAPCFQDEYIGQTLSNLCNQGTNTQIVNCYYSTGNWPTESTVSGLQFIRGYPTTGNGNLAPVLRTAYFSTNTCSTGTDYYFNAHPTNACTASLTATLNIGSENFPVGPPAGPQVRTGSNVEVRYRIVSDTGNTCAFNTATCSLNGAAGPGTRHTSPRTRSPRSRRTRDETQLRSAFATGAPSTSARRPVTRAATTVSSTSQAPERRREAQRRPRTLRFSPRPFSACSAATARCRATSSGYGSRRTRGAARPRRRTRRRRAFRTVRAIIASSWTWGSRAVSQSTPASSRSCSTTASARARWGCGLRPDNPAGQGAHDRCR